MPDTRPLMDHLRSPFEPADIRGWDGAESRAQRNASIWLYDAIVSGNTNLVRAMLDAGARVNTELYASALPQETLPRRPLALAWWLQTHTDNGEEHRPRSGPDGDVLPDNGMVSMLIDAGAYVNPDLLRMVHKPQWEHVRQPTFMRLEHAILGHLRERHDMARSHMVINHQERAFREEMFLIQDSVVPSTDTHGGHLWLHRAIHREDWAALHGWLDLNGVINTKDTDPVMAMLWQPMLGATAVNKRTPERLKALDALRARLLTDEDDGIYRAEVIGLLRLQDRFHAMPTPVAGLDACETWTMALLGERSLNSFHLQPMDRALLSDVRAAALQQRLTATEQALLRAPLARPGETSSQEPARVRPRL